MVSLFLKKSHRILEVYFLAPSWFFGPLYYAAKISAFLATLLRLCSAYVRLRGAKQLFLCRKPHSAWASSLEMVLRRAVPPEFCHYAGAHRSAEHPSPERNRGLKRTRTDAIFKKFDLKMELKLRLNVIWKHFGLQIFQLYIL
jgi:hypothetical protein